MTERELHKLNRQDLLELLVAQSRQVGELQEQVDTLKRSVSELDETVIRLKNKVSEKDNKIEELERSLAAGEPGADGEGSAPGSDVSYAALLAELRRFRIIEQQQMSDVLNRLKMTVDLTVKMREEKDEEIRRLQARLDSQQRRRERIIAKASPKSRYSVKYK